MFAQNRLTKLIIYRFIQIQYTHRYYLVQGAENIHGIKYIQLFFISP